MQSFHAMNYEAVSNVFDTRYVSCEAENGVFDAPYEL